MTTCECLKTFSGHPTWVQSVKLLDEHLVLKTIKLIWKIATGNCIKTLLGHSDCEWEILVLSNKRIASCTDDKTIRIWDKQSGDYTKVLKSHTKSVICITMLLDKRFLSGSHD